MRSRKKDQRGSTEGARANTVADAAARAAERPAIERILSRSERWYADGEPRWTVGRNDRPAMTSKQAENLRWQTVKLLRRHGKGDPMALALADRIASCRLDHRCLSGGCPACRRAAQRVFVAGSEGLTNRSKNIDVTAVSVVYWDARIPDRGMQKLPDLFEPLSRRIRAALSAAGVRQAIGGFDISANEHAAGGFAQHYRPHAWLFLPTRQLARFHRFRQHFPLSATVRRPVVTQAFDGDRRAWAYALKVEFQRRTTLPRQVQPDNTVMRRNTRDRPLLARQKVEVALALDKAGLDARLFFHGLRLVAMGGEPRIRGFGPTEPMRLSRPASPFRKAAVVEGRRGGKGLRSLGRSSKGKHDQGNRVLE